MAPPADRVYTLARDVLGALIAGYATAAADLPARRLVTPGLPAWDCEGVYVQVERIYRHEGNVTVEVPQPLTAHPGHAMSAAVIAVTIVRCTPGPDQQGNPPAAAAEEAVAEQVMTDAQLSLNVLVAAQKAGDLPLCNGMAFVEWVSVGPEGILVGGVLRLQAGIGR